MLSGWLSLASQQTLWIKTWEAEWQPYRRDDTHLTIRVYSAVVLVIFGAGGFFKCFSSHSPVLGLRCRKMKWTLLVAPHLSGPNMIVKGVCEDVSVGLARVTRREADDKK